ncbi:MAG: methylase involved in ubiquinone/menaquinone biosynthesis [Candidatus Aminicenantes bacterium]|nr:methylase involved in ubiquinone/menaquinone biosynthesis [Candidatus Aminicenantes bacterium]
MTFAAEQTRRAYNLAAQAYHDLFHNELAEKEYDRKLLDAFAARFPAGALICDGGCGPSAHIGRYLLDKGLRVIGVDISDRCVEQVRAYDPGMPVVQGNIARLGFRADSFDGVVSYYSIIHTPKDEIGGIFGEFRRILKPGGSLLVAVKAGSGEGYRRELLGIETEIYFSLFTEAGIEGYFKDAGFRLDFVEKRDPYGFEIANERIFAVGRRP